MKIHFVGAGGIGVSAIAKYYLDHGHKITGSDLARSEITDDLKQRGAKIFPPHQNKFGAGQVGHCAENLSDNTDLVIYSPAVKSDNPEMVKAKRLGIECLSYPEALGKIVKNHYTIAVTGTHGKSTTTCMLGLLLQEAGLDPTVIVGTKLKEFGDSNYRGGKSKYLVIEACEHFESFLNYWPKNIIITNIEPDHLDYYKNFKNVVRGFTRFVSHLPKDGLLIANKDDKDVVGIAKNTKSRVKYYSLKQPEAKEIKKILKVPGQHNVSDALAALTVARDLNIPEKVSFKALSKFHGSWRRFDIKKVKINGKNITLISDYAHHPTEIKATLDAAAEKYLYPSKFSKGKFGRANKKIWCVFQPHQYQRTYYLFDEFVKVFKNIPIDKLFIADIYDVAGREETKIKKIVSSEKLVAKINKANVAYIKDAEDYLAKNLKGGEVLIIMGAGDIYNLTTKLARG